MQYGCCNYGLVIMQLLKKKWCMRMVVIGDALSPLKFSKNKAKCWNFEQSWFSNNLIWPTACKAGKVKEWSKAPVKYVCFWWCAFTTTLYQKQCNMVVAIMDYNATVTKNGACLLLVMRFHHSSLVKRKPSCEIYNKADSVIN